ncbi:hypothetical protein [Photobacterium leiognathi]|uniref:hypothetical protein n=1 Tax=Photobacterium leiognathi TaxID=553611 RepID=UPI0029810CCF|nr:hypothetical protein [Photobacterium leiognathi]
MKLFSRVNAAILTLFLSLFSFSALAENKVQDVHFKKGATSAEYTGKVQGYDFNEYVFYAQKGQALKATLDTKSTKLWFILLNQHIENRVDLSEYSESLTPQGTYILPYSGKYTIRIGQYRAFARRGEHSEYKLKIEIK